jgi:hypothetical protein
MIGKLLFNKTEVVSGNDGVLLQIPVMFTDPYVGYIFITYKSSVYNEIIDKMAKTVDDYLHRKGLISTTKIKASDIIFCKIGLSSRPDLPYISVPIITVFGVYIINYFNKIRKI